MLAERRLDDLETRTRALEARMARWEEAPPAKIAAFAPASPSPAAVSPWRAPAAVPPSAPRVLPPAPRARRSPADLEDLLGGRVLAWVGGLAVLLG